MDTLQHSPRELPPPDTTIKGYSSIPVLIRDSRGYVVARYDYALEEDDGGYWYVDDGYIQSRENAGVYGILAWWYCPVYNEGF